MRVKSKRSGLRVGGGMTLLVAGVVAVATSSFAEDVVPPAPTDVAEPAGDPAAEPVAEQAQPEGGRNGGNSVDVTTDADRAAVASSLEATGANASTSAGADTTLDQYMANKNSGKFTGRPITLQVRDIDAADVFRLIGEASGFNIVLSDEVKGRLTLSLTDVPWDQALDVVLHTLRLGAERNNNVLRITTLESLTNEKQELLRAQRASEASAPKITKVFPISYASLSELQGTIQKFVSSSSDPGGGATGAESALTQAVVQVDNRTNSIIVRDLPQNVERIAKLIQVLDTQTPQVLVEAKIVEATEGFSKSITGSLGGVGSTDSEANQFGASFGGGNPTDPLIGSPGIFSGGTAFGQTSTNNGSASGTLGGSLSPASLRFLPGIRRLNAILNLGENESQVKILSSPRTVVVNKQSASIVQSTPVLVPTVVQSAIGTGIGTSVQQANLSLNVTPTVTNDGGVLMTLTVSRDIPFILGGGNTAVANRNINTQVLVESGSTLVIGGIYTSSTLHSASGFPYLRKIPILGAFFGSENDSTERSELFIFITPRILNVKEAGLTG